MNLYKIFVAVTLLFLSQTAVVFAQAGPPSSVTITSVTKVATNYVYHIEGVISDADYQGFDDMTAFDYVIRIPDPSNPAGFVQFDLTDDPSFANAVWNADGSVSFNFDVPLPFDTAKTVSLVKDGLTPWDTSLVNIPYDFAAARAQADAAILDTDGDGLNDAVDPDDDNDGIPDTIDAVTEVPLAVIPDPLPPPLPPITLAGGCSLAQLQAETTMNGLVTCVAAFGSNVNRLLIGFGVLASVFLLPYAGVLYASGNPGNIEKANEVLTAWASGLVLLLLSGSIILILGGSVFGVT